MRNEEGEKDYLVDALFKLFEYNQLEILLLETSGAYGNNNATKIDFDNHKGMYGLLAMLKEIASTYNFARIECFYKLRVYFVQAANKSLYLWSLRYLEGDVYEMWREEKIEVDDNFNNKDSIVPMIQFLWNLKGRLEDMVEHLNIVQKKTMRKTRKDTASLEKRLSS
ncbi:hypothetical protein CU097_014689 [Rhizopus azygosporus]|uniref:Uncharacterized protein n=1 Tax=Rhizopus azygosporus TaxID=86630 RepID=A0A367K6N9_RHIAZ|nr:hypothetical protein CU097_014689 [Rhizopus azygosporus]